MLDFAQRDSWITFRC